MPKQQAPTKRKTTKPPKIGVLFEKELHLVAILQFSLDDRAVGAYLLKRGKNSYRVVFVWNCEGIHPTLSLVENGAILEQLEGGLKNLPSNEELTLHLDIFAGDRNRQRELSQLFQQAEEESQKFLLTGERARVQEQAQKGERKPSSLRLSATYTLGQNAQTQDWLGKVLSHLEWLSKRLNGQIGKFNNQRLEAQLKAAYTEGFQRWERLFSSMGLKVRPLSPQEHWEAAYSRLNRSHPPAIPQLLMVSPSELREKLTSRLDARTHLTREGVPEAGKRWVRVGGRYVASLVLLEKPGEISLHYLYERLSRESVRDIEVFCQLAPADPRLAKFAMEMVTKQASHAAERAATRNNVDVGSEMQIEEAVSAQREMGAGAVPIYCAVVVLIYRKTLRELDAACRQLESDFSRPAWVAREEQLTWRLWLQTLGVTGDRLMVFGSGLFDQRQVYLSSEVAELMPLLKPRPGDARGVELIATGGEPICIDLFQKHRNLVIFGSTRSGKSVLVAVFLTQALARQIPAIALDFPGADGRSTFTDYTQFVGGAYFDISAAQNNLFELPDVRHLAAEKQRERLADYSDFLSSALLTMVVGRETQSSLAQTIRDLLNIALDAFFASPAIRERYDRAFSGGFGSPAWGEMPTLKDFAGFCTAESLELGEEPGGEIETALNKIGLRLRSWLTSRVGKAIASPSSFRTDSLLLVFALRGLSNNEDAAVLSLSAYSAALRRALSYEASLFFIDEAPILFEFDEISSLIGRLCANGAKQGIRVILTGQDPDTIASSVAGAKILQNINTRLVGRIQPTAVASFERIFRYPTERIARNASESFFPNPKGVYSNWLLDDSGTFYLCRYYPSYVLLALTANNPDEKSARAKVLAAYANEFEGIAQFAKLLKRSIQSGQPLKTVVAEWERDRETGR